MPIILEQRGDWLSWQRHRDETEHAKFQITEVAQISVVPLQVYGGAFQEIVGIVWQVRLILHNQSEFLIHEAHSATNAFAKAEQLSHHFAVPVIVPGSEGNGQYAAESLNLARSLQRTKVCPTIRCQKSAQQWHLYSEWRASSSWRFLKEVVAKFGFLLFTVIVANLMIFLGGLLHFSLCRWFVPEMIGQIELFPSRFNWIAILQLGLALAIMIYKGAKLSREEHLYITPDQLTFFIGSQRIAQVSTASIKALLFLQQPFPMLLVLTADQTIEICELQHETEFRALLSHLDSAITTLNMLKIED